MFRESSVIIIAAGGVALALLNFGMWYRRRHPRMLVWTFLMLAVTVNSVGMLLNSHGVGLRAAEPLMVLNVLFLAIAAYLLFRTIRKPS